jgi:glyoxylase-like metal-dependent hydrolase (beta-lactamase superfamily II)
MLALWATPHGFVKAAMANQATTRNVPGGTEVSFTIGGKYKMSGIINPQRQVERVQTWIAHPLAGDLLMETVYRVYRDFNGVLFPSSIVESQGGFPALELTTVSVQTNSAVTITVPANVRGAQPPPVRVNSEKLAEGVYFFTGGGANSLAIEMRDHIVLVDTPTNEPRALAVIAKAKELIPNKPVRFVINTHHHWDHSGGIRTAMDEGATIVTHEINKAFFEKVATMPHTLVPDRLSVSKKAAKLQTVGDKGQLTDGTRTIELYAIPGIVHAAGMLMVYLPKEKILIQADAPGRLDAPPNPLLRPVRILAASAVYDNIVRRKLDVQTMVPLHGPIFDMATFAKALGKRTSSN